MSKEQDERRKRERDEFLRAKAERWERIQQLPNEKFTKELFESLASEEIKILIANKTGFSDYVNNVLFGAKK